MEFNKFGPYQYPKLTIVMSSLSYTYVFITSYISTSKLQKVFEETTINILRKQSIRLIFKTEYVKVILQGNMTRVLKLISNCIFHSVSDKYNSQGRYLSFH